MTSKVSAHFDRYYLYQEITDYVHGVAQAYPELASVQSIGKSYEGRDIWGLTITNRATGQPEQKPGIYFDGNIHAGEVTASMTCLHIIDYLLENFSSNDDVTHLLNTRTFYVVPRANPDGAEKYLTTPYTLRSSVRVWPEETQDLPGLHAEDINGDGWILQMRVRDDKLGGWKISDKDSRMMIPRRPSERKGPFYHIYTEGTIKDYEGKPFDVVRTPWGLDMNRNFPSNWDPSVQGGGDYPTSEPEIKAIVDFIIAHKNIGQVNSFHTSGGLFFRNPYQYGDDKIDQEDLRAIKEIAREGTRVTGYPDVKSSNRACLPEWMYEHHGVIGYTTELWDRMGQAGLNGREVMAITDPEKREEINLKLLEWNDRALCGKGFFNWTPFEHPQLGPVEIGGWNPKFVVQNAPHHLLPGECYKNTLWALNQAAALPELEISELQVERLGDQCYKVTAVVQNNGYLCTNITNKALQVKAVQTDKVSLKGDGVEVIGSKATVDIGHLQGYIKAQVNPYGPTPVKSSARVKWVVKATPGTAVTITLRSQRGGTIEKEIVL